MTNIISISPKECSTNTDSDFNEKDETHFLKVGILKSYFKSIEIKKYNSLPLIVYQRDEKNKNIRYIYFHDKIIEKISRNFAINTLFVNSKIYYRQNNFGICTKIKNENNVVNKNINNEEKISNMSTKDSLSLFIPKTRKYVVNFFFCKKNYCNYIPRLKDMNKSTESKTAIFSNSNLFRN